MQVIVTFPFDEVLDATIADTRVEYLVQIEPKAPPKKWRVCQAFHAVNAATQVPAFPSGDLKTKQQAVVGK